MAANYDEFVKSLPKQEVIAAIDSLRRPVDVAVYGSKNGWNFGAILRLGHGFLVSKYWAIDIPWYYPKAAMTAKQWEKYHINNVTENEFIEKTQGRNIVAFERREKLPKENKDLMHFNFPENPILLFGAEDFGVPEKLLERADHIVTIPVMGLVYDHNVANAAGIGLYAWHCQYTAPNHYRHK